MRKYFYAISDIISQEIFSIFKFNNALIVIDIVNLVVNLWLTFFV